MKKNGSIKIKATFLLVVFALNIVVGFACGLGINMGFNAHDLEKKKGVSKIHVHADGKKHVHGYETGKPSHSGKKHHDEEGGCCTDGVVKLAQTEKAIPQSTALTNPIFSTVFIAIFYYTNIFYKSQVVKPIKYFVRGHHPPIPDIRIAIRSFQI
ncbi:MAG: hypothetical protein JWP81_455 [Ferruginibacter sp.]|nr:hypothetical protein [Ferruginibacter sp.]